MSKSYTPTSLQLSWFRFAAMLCFNQISVLGRPDIPIGQPILYLGLHRNGALDGLPYAKAAPKAAFLVSSQLHRFALGRFLFPGIPVSRKKDRQRGITEDNQASIERCVEHLATGGELFIMPEGTSTLGPCHLPFKRGAARIAHAVLELGSALTIVPVAVHYECAWEWQSRVEVVFGVPLNFKPQEFPDTESLQQLFSDALVNIGINVDTEERLRLIEMLAYGATLGTNLNYSNCLKRFEREIPLDLLPEITALEEAVSSGPAMRHQGVPLVPIRYSKAYLLVWLLLAPLVFLFVIGNLPVLLAGYFGSLAFPDDRNVVSLWRLIIALPAIIIWCPLVSIWIWNMLGAGGVFIYFLVSIVGLRLSYRFRKLTVAVFNSIFASRLRKPLLSLYEKLLRYTS